MKKIWLFFLISIFSTQMEAQQQAAVITGEYYLTGVMETASGFKLNEDHTFEFFFSYGALDRAGQGTWKQEANKISFFCLPQKEADFSLVRSKSTDEDAVTIRIIDADPVLRAHVYALLKSGNKQWEEMSGSAGEIRFPKVDIDSITLVLEFCPEKRFVFNSPAKSHNQFEFRMEPAIMEVFFEQLTLTLTGEGMQGQHPLLRQGMYQFRKN